MIPETLDSDHPLPVVDADGQVTGRLSRSALAEVLSDHANDAASEKNVEVIKKVESKVA